MGEDYSRVLGSSVGSELEEAGIFCVVLGIFSDNLLEGNESFALALQTEQEFVQLTTPNTTITIVDSDSELTICRNLINVFMCAF